MKKPNEIKELRSQATPAEIAEVTWIIAELEQFLKGDVSSGGVTRLDNISTSFNNFKRTYTQRVIRLLKTGHMID
mgnify:CR=1 FL=1